MALFLASIIDIGTQSAVNSKSGTFSKFVISASPSLLFPIVSLLTILTISECI